MTVDGFIIGAQKAGSTSLDRYLAAHPEVLGARHEVPALEDPGYSLAAVSEVNDWVARHRTSNEQRVVLRRPNYLCLPEVPARMAAEWPSARLIAVLRDPVQRALSAYFHYMRYGLTPVTPVDEGLGRLVLGQQPRGYPRATEILTFGRYGEAIERWCDSAGREKLLVLDTVLLRKSPSTALSSVASHLNIADDVPLPNLSDGMPGSYGMAHVKARSMVRPLLYRRWASHRLSPRGKLPQLYDRTERLLWRDTTQRPDLEHTVGLALRDYYRDDMQALARLLGSRDQPSWLADYT